MGMKDFWLCVNLYTLQLLTVYAQLAENGRLIVALRWSPIWLYGILASPARLFVFLDGQNVAMSWRMGVVCSTLLKTKYFFKNEVMLTERPIFVQLVSPIHYFYLMVALYRCSCWVLVDMMMPFFYFYVTWWLNHWTNYYCYHVR